MPVGSHFKGRGKEVMASMEKTYGPEKGKSVFYATENKNKKKSQPKAKPVFSGKGGMAVKGF